MKTCPHCPRRYYTSYGYLRHLKEHEDTSKRPEAQGDTQAVGLFGALGQGDVLTETQARAFGESRNETLLKASSEAQTKVQGQVLTQVEPQVSALCEFQDEAKSVAKIGAQVENAAVGQALAELRASDGSGATKKAFITRGSIPRSSQSLPTTRKFQDHLGAEGDRGENSSKLHSEVDGTVDSVANSNQSPGLDSPHTMQEPTRARIREPDEDREVKKPLNEDDPRMNENETPENEEETAKNEDENLSTHSCGICSETFSSESDLRRHSENVHNKSELIGCEICQSLLSSLQSRCNHRGKTHEGVKKTQKSEKGLEEYLYCNQLERQISISNDDSKYYECKVCPTEISIMNSLTAHIKSIHGTSQTHKCKLCSKTFTLRGTLKRHIKDMHDRRSSHKCELCSKTFGYMGNLKRHTKVVHEGIRSHKCELCSKAFGFRSYLKNHLKIKHPSDSERQSKVNAKVVKCEICPKAFENTRRRDQHVQVFHEKIKPYKCDRCSKVFGIRSSLERHVKSSHESSKAHL